MKKDMLIKAILANQQLLFTALKSMDEDEEDDDSHGMMDGMEDKMTAAMVKAIKLTRSPHRTFGTNGSYAAP